MVTEEIELTILMPCLNEEATIGICISKGLQFFMNYHINGEILIADNGSTDGSIRIAENLGARVVRVKEKGYGNALSGGIMAAKGRFVIMGDSDDSYDFTNLMPFLGKLREGYDLVMGNRFKGGIQKNAMPFLHRYVGNPVLSLIGRIFFQIGIRDFHCGLRGFNRESILKIQLNTTGMEFASEMVVKSALNQLRITEVPTTLSKDGREHPPHLNTWRDGWRHLRFLLIYSPRWLFLYPGVFFMLIGIVLSLMLVYKTLVIGSIKLDVHTLIYSSSAIVIGFQFISFFIFTKAFAINNGLLPESKNFDRLFRYFELEKGLIIGFIVLLAGTALSISAFTIWGELSFGPLDPVKILRLVIPGSTLIILGVQIILNSFFLSILGLRN
jgi:glycosyltransferase involved in cell wall biosynthesis